MKSWRVALKEGQVIPASPLALSASGIWSEKYQRGLTRYYRASGAGGVAVGVHTTQFQIRQHGLLEPVLRSVAETLDEEGSTQSDMIRVAGICGKTSQAIQEAELARSLGYHLGLLSPAALRSESEEAILEHTREIADVIPVFGFYLQPAVGGRTFSVDYWRQLSEIPNVLAIKVAAFNRYQTIEVVRAVAESERRDLSIYTGNDDNIIVDLLTPFRLAGQTDPTWIVGGLLGQWAVWTKQAVSMLERIKTARQSEVLDFEWLAQNARLTEANRAIFDTANDFAGCIPGVNEILTRQGLLPSAACLDPSEVLSEGQAAELDKITGFGFDEDQFIRDHLAEWLRD